MIQQCNKWLWNVFSHTNCNKKIYNIGYKIICLKLIFIEHKFVSDNYVEKYENIEIFTKKLLLLQRITA